VSKVKKFLSRWLLGVVIIMLLTGCSDFDIRDYILFIGDRYSGERPFDYPPARWISDTPNIWFDVVPYFKDENKEWSDLEGILETSEHSIKIIVWFPNTDIVVIREQVDKDNRWLRGTCKFSPDKLIITIEKEKDTLLNGQYDTITFIRVPED
jgi:hypothetical protein